MTLKEANKELEKLENDYEFFLNEKAEIEGIVLPKSPSYQQEKVDGGKRQDLLAKYVELKDLKAIDETLNYISRQKKSIMKWIENELKILEKYSDIERLIVHYKEEDTRNLTWLQIAQLVHYSSPQCRRIYQNYKRKRNA